MIFTAFADGRFRIGERWTRCALGRGGVIAAADKREGDGCSPLGLWPIRRVLYRADRAPPPVTQLPVQTISPQDGWCDDPADPAYNRPVRLPYAAGHERMWREDPVYDIVCTLAHNDNPPEAGLGSAIFLHLAHDDYRPTQGCVALTRPDMEDLLAQAGRDPALAVQDEPRG